MLLLGHLKVTTTHQSFLYQIRFDHPLLSRTTGSRGYKNEVRLRGLNDKGGSQPGFGIIRTQVQTGVGNPPYANYFFLVPPTFDYENQFVFNSSYPFTLVRLRITS